jgi:cytochrome c oxidase subunit 4
MADKHPQGTGWIWRTFWILLIVTAVEVALGIIQPAALEVPLFGTRLLNYIFIILTLVKAYYIVAFFMHLKYEKTSLKWTIYLPALILIPYLTFIVLTEGSYMFG